MKHQAVSTEEKKEYLELEMGPSIRLCMVLSDLVLY